MLKTKLRKEKKNKENHSRMVIIFMKDRLAKKRDK